MGRVLHPRIDLICGYEMTGKSYLIKNGYSDVPSYRPFYQEMNTDDYLERNSVFLLGLTISDFFRKNPQMLTKDIVIDRGLIDALPYASLHPWAGPAISKEDLKTASKIIKESNSRLVYCYHSDQEVAHHIFDMARQSGDHTDKYDDVIFDSYWRNYNKYDSVASEVIYGICTDLIGTHIISVSTSDLLGDFDSVVRRLRR